MALRTIGTHTFAQDLEARYERLQMELVSSERFCRAAIDLPETMSAI